MGTYAVVILGLSWFTLAQAGDDTFAVPATYPASHPVATPRSQPESEEAKRLFNEAVGLLKVLQEKKEFLEQYRSQSLLAECAALRYRNQPKEALEQARGLTEPFYSSLALGAIAAQLLPDNPIEAQKLLMEAQSQALTIDHWTGSDATSLGYLFQLIQMFKQKQAREILGASRGNLNSRRSNPTTKQHAMLVLSQATLAVDPSQAASLLEEACKATQYYHYYESVQLLGRYEARTRKGWATKELEAFYRSGRDWPASYEVISAVLLEDALADLPKASERIKTLPEGKQDAARVSIAQALKVAGRKEEASAVLEVLESRMKADAMQAQWVRDYATSARARWAAEEEVVRAVSAEDIVRFLAKPTAEALRTVAYRNRPMAFQDAKQASAFVTAALPLAREIWDMGYPHHGSPRSVLLGTLARIKAIQGEPEQAKKIADEITIPELKAFYLLQAYEACHPLPDVVRAWPLHFYPRPEIRIGQ